MPNLVSSPHTLEIELNASSLTTYNLIFMWNSKSTMGFGKSFCTDLVMCLFLVEYHGNVLSSKKVGLRHCKKQYRFKEGTLVKSGGL